jgi:plasmid stabilization system protein ParE
VKLRYSRRASADIRAAVSWWRVNRPAAQDLLREELRRAVTLLKAQPRVGAPALDVAVEGVRRWLLSSSSYFLYYRVKADTVEVLRLWHTSRGAPPKI